MRSWRQEIHAFLCAIACSASGLAILPVATRADELTDRLLHCLRPGPGTQCVVNSEPVSFPGLQDPDTQQPVRGCYDALFNRLSDALPGGSGPECPSNTAPIFVDVVVTTHCGVVDQGRCSTGGYLRVSHVMEIQGDSQSPGALSKLSLVLPQTPWIISASGVMDRLRVTCEGLPGHVFDPHLRTCVQKPEALCAELGLSWKNGSCQPPSLRCSSCAADEMNYCRGYVYVPSNGSCFCEGKNTTMSRCKFPLPLAQAQPARGVSLNRLICPPRPSDAIGGGGAPTKDNQYNCQPYQFSSGRESGCLFPNWFNPWTGKCDTPDDLKPRVEIDPSGVGVPNAVPSDSAPAGGKTESKK